MQTGNTGSALRSRAQGSVLSVKSSILLFFRQVLFLISQKFSGKQQEFRTSHWAQYVLNRRKHSKGAIIKAYHLRTGSQEEPFIDRTTIKSARMALRKSQSTIGKPSDPPEWLSGRAIHRSNSRQISPNGSQEEPINHREAIRSAWMALRKSHSTTGKPSDPPEWLSGRAIRL